MFSKKLITRIKEVYPDKSDLVTLAESGSDSVITKLNNLSDSDIDIGEIIDLIEQNSNESLQALLYKAKVTKQRLDLFYEALEEFNNYDEKLIALDEQK